MHRSRKALDKNCLHGLIGVISSSFASYQTAEEKAALIRYQRRGGQGLPLPDSCWRFFQPYRL